MNIVSWFNWGQKFFLYLFKEALTLLSFDIIQILPYLDLALKEFINYFFISLKDLIYILRRAWMHVVHPSLLKLASYTVTIGRIRGLIRNCPIRPYCRNLAASIIKRRATIVWWKRWLALTWWVSIVLSLISFGYSLVESII